MRFIAIDNSDGVGSLPVLRINSHGHYDKGDMIMESVLGLVQSPVFLGILVFLGLASLIRVLLARDPKLKRIYRGDRRRGSKMPETPFHDSEGVLITENRRTQTDRRHTRMLAMQHEMKQDSRLIEE